MTRKANPQKQLGIPFENFISNARAAPWIFPFNANDLFTVTEAEPLLLIVIGDVGASRGGYPAVVAAVAGSGAARRGHTAGPVPPPPGPAEGAVREGLLVAGVDHLPCKTNTRTSLGQEREVPRTVVAAEPVLRRGVVDPPGVGVLHRKGRRLSVQRDGGAGRNESGRRGRERRRRVVGGDCVFGVV